MGDVSQWRILDAGDSAFVVEFGDTIDTALAAEVKMLDRHLRRLQQAGRLPGLIETVPTFRSLAVVFDPLVTTPGSILSQADAAMPELSGTPESASREWSLPVAYGGNGGPDLDTVARRTGLCTDEVISQHLLHSYNAYMLGFQPGFAFLGDLPGELHLPRRDQPRVRVPRGSVAIANQLTAVYPWESPGGWHLIGYCPAPLFDTRWAAPALLQVGDRVRFTRIDERELISIERAWQAGEFEVDTLRTR